MDPTSIPSARSKDSLYSVYVTDLPWQADECYLYHIFKRFGPIQRVEVRRDPETKVSLGNALISYEPGCNQEIVQQVIDEMNYTEMFGKSVRLMRHMPDPETRKSLLEGGANLFVKNLGKQMTSKSLYSAFQQFGSIISCKVQATHSGECKGYGYVSFKTKEEANNAIKNMNDRLLNGRALYVAYFVPKTASKEIRSRWQKLFVTNLDPRIDSASLRNMFERFGNVREAVVCTNTSGKTRCFGFVEFHERENAEVAKEVMHNQTCGQGQLHVDFAQQKIPSNRCRIKGSSELTSWIKPLYTSASQKNALHIASKGSSFSVGIPGYKVFVNGLHLEVGDECLKKQFMIFGEIIASRVIRNRVGTSTGMGIIGFQNPQNARSTVLQMNGTNWKDQIITVSLLPDSWLSEDGFHHPAGTAEKENRAVEVDGR